MAETVNELGLNQYLSIFGLEKMQNLWAEFVGDAKKKLSNLENKSQEEKRLTYHSLRSSSLIFGMQEFSDLCQVYEEKILAGNAISVEEIDESRILLIDSINEVKTHLK